jgi:para-nitrobenzyl esterase
MWRILDFGGHIGNEDMYLIEGKDRAILFDTGMGRGDLGAYVKRLTKLPVDVAITHGNRGHFLQVDQFPDSTVYLSELDV